MNCIPIDIDNVIDIAPYSLSSVNPLKCISLRNVQNRTVLHTTVNITFGTVFTHRQNLLENCEIIHLCKEIQYKFTSRIYGAYTLALNWNHGGISGDVHFAGHL